jgi:hypothetical protein
VKTSREGIQFIAGREALVLVAYEDGENPDGKPRYSIGFGDNSAKAGDKIAPDEAWKASCRQYPSPRERLLTAR